MRASGRRTRLLGSTIAGALSGIVVAGLLVLGFNRLHHAPTDLHAMLHDAVPLDAQEAQFLDIKEREFEWHRRQI